MSGVQLFMAGPQASKVVVGCRVGLYAPPSVYTTLLSNTLKWARLLKNHYLEQENICQLITDKPNIPVHKGGRQ